MRSARTEDILKFAREDVSGIHQNIHDLSMYVNSKWFTKLSRFLMRRQKKLTKEVDEFEKPRDTVFGYFKGRE